MGKKNSSTDNKRRKRRFFKLKWLLYLFIFGLIITGIGYVVFQIKTKPYKEQAAKYSLDEIGDVEVVSKILDRKGRELGRIFVENRDEISIKEVPQTMINALVSGEDQRFFEHDGVDRVGVLRALYLNWEAGKQTQGASTITQQLARNAFHLKEEAKKLGQSGMERKAVEAYLAQRIEERYTKFEILEFYLNRIPFGSGYYGIRSASLGYFGVEPKDLTVSQCASLVGCIRNPLKNSPLNDLAMNQSKRDQVLGRMVDDGFLSQAEHDKLIAEPVVVNPRPIRRGTSHLYERIAGKVREHLGEDALTQGGFKIHTTIDLDVQRAMTQSLLKQLDAIEAKPGYAHAKIADFQEGKPEYLQGAGLMVDNSSGAVIAYVGGRDFNHSQYDFIQSGKKPIGTAFLPFLAVTAFEKNLSLSHKLLDRPMDNRAIMLDGREGIVGEWGMETLTPKYEGDITLRRAIEVSKIAASVRLGKTLGLGTVMETARKFGLSFPETELLARMLVGTEEVSLPQIVRAYAAFANLGKRGRPMFFVDRIVDSSGVEVYTAPSLDMSTVEQTISQDHAYLTHSLLQGALRGTAKQNGGSSITRDPGAAGKTGTTYDFANNWFVGYNSRVTCGVWAGFHAGHREPIYEGAFSRETIYPVWENSMVSAANTMPGQAISPPENIVQLEVCKESGMRKTRYCQKFHRDAVSGQESYLAITRVEYFLKGVEPTGYCDIHGAVDDSLAKQHNFAAESSSSKTTHTYTIPIQPKAPLLLGNDPYGSEQPDFAPRDESATRERSKDSMVFDQLEEEDRDAAILIDRPNRIRIEE
ncbi:MAG: transglycosylase domain-containing protein [Akkermansiaceae bacterium]